MKKYSNPTTNIADLQVSVTLCGYGSPYTPGSVIPSPSGDGSGDPIPE